MKDLIERITSGYLPSKAELMTWIDNHDKDSDVLLFAKARAMSLAHFGNRIYTRGLIEVSNFCRNDCYYCGIRRSQADVSRYRLNQEEILSACAEGYQLGFRTFVLQGGEDPYFTAARVAGLVRAIKEVHPDCAVTLSLGEYPEEDYRLMFEAGADRYLLRHETADAAHYAKLHPAELSLAQRLSCLNALKKIGFQVGVGFMVGSPYQTTASLADDLRFIAEFKPEMIGIGPFIPAHGTPFAQESQGRLEEVLFFIGLLRIMNPFAMIPATTALGSIDPKGRQLGILAGANVLMPNLSPQAVRAKYALYDHKLSSGLEAAEYWRELEQSMQEIGYTLAVDKGDYSES